MDNKQKHNADENECTEILKMACSNCMLRKPSLGNWKPAYWWCDEVRSLRDNCLKSKRTLTRKRKKQEDITKDIAEYRKRRKALKKAIKRDKKAKRVTLCKELDEDIWGLGYKIVTKNFYKNPPIDEETEMAAIKHLFPYKPEKRIAVGKDKITSNFTHEELNTVYKKINTKKSTGLDGIPPIIIKKS